MRTTINNNHDDMKAMKAAKDEMYLLQKKLLFSHQHVCAICERAFFSDEKHALFCDFCKNHSETYRFADWLS